MDELDDLFGVVAPKPPKGKAKAPHVPAPAASAASSPAPMQARGDDGLYDAACADITRANPNMLIPWFLMAQYLYYYRDSIILSDACFDHVSRTMQEKWASLDHAHKSAAALYVEQGRPQLLPLEYPLMARATACRLAGIAMQDHTTTLRSEASHLAPEAAPPAFRVQQDVMARRDISGTGIKQGAIGKVIYVQHGHMDTDRSTSLAATAFQVRFKGGGDLWMTTDELAPHRSTD